MTSEECDVIGVAGYDLLVADVDGELERLSAGHRLPAQDGEGVAQPDTAAQVD
jgi:hypothetical protein